MLRRDPNYRRVRAGGKDIAGRASYWLAEDHLLVVREEGFTERYRRFFHRDVQALVISRTKLGLIFTLIFTPLSGLSFLFVMGTESAEGKWIFSGITALCVIGLLANLLAGPTCECHLRTAVQSERLPAVRRVKRAHRLIAAMTPLIGRAQSDLPQNPVPPPPLPPSAPDLPVPEPFIPLAAPQVVRHYHGQLHSIAFGLVIVDAALGFLLLASQNMKVSHINTAENFIEWGFLIAALIRGRRTDIPKALRNAMWTVLGYYALKFVASIALGFILAINGGITSPDALHPWNSKPMFIYLLISNLFLLLVGLWGMRALRKFRKEYQTPVPPPMPAVAAAPSLPPDETMVPPPPAAPNA